jgi:hypothetical protein
LPSNNTRASAPNFHLDRYFAASGLPDFKELNVASPDYFRQANGMIDSTPEKRGVGAWRERSMCICSTISPVISFRMARRTHSVWLRRKLAQQARRNATVALLPTRLSAFIRSGSGAPRNFTRRDSPASSSASRNVLNCEDNYLTRSRTSVQVVLESPLTYLIVIVRPSLARLVVLVWMTEPFFLSTEWSAPSTLL